MISGAEFMEWINEQTSNDSIGGQALVDALLKPFMSVTHTIVLDTIRSVHRGTAVAVYLKMCISKNKSVDVNISSINSAIRDLLKKKMIKQVRVNTMLLKEYGVKSASRQKRAYVTVRAQ